MEKDLRNAKTELRRSLRSRLASVTPQQRETWSGAIVRRLEESNVWSKRGGVAAVFGGAATEPDLLPLLPWLRARGWKIAFFTVGDAPEMQPRLVRGEGDLVTGALGVLEPAAARCPSLDAAELDVILVPGLAFSVRNGARLGRGKGFYDRFLSGSGVRARVIGAGFALQMLQEVPREPHDAMMQALVSEDGLIDIQPSAPGR